MTKSKSVVKAPVKAVKATKSKTTNPVRKAKATIEKVNPAKATKKAKATAKAKQPAFIVVPEMLSTVYQQLISNGVVSQVDIAKKLGCSTASVTRYVYRRRGNKLLDGSELRKDGKPRLPHATLSAYITMLKWANELCAIKENKVRMPAKLKKLI